MQKHKVGGVADWVSDESWENPKLVTTVKLPSDLYLHPFRGHSTRQAVFPDKVYQNIAVGNRNEPDPHHDGNPNPSPSPGARHRTTFATMSLSLNALTLSVDLSPILLPTAFQANAYKYAAENT